MVNPIIRVLLADDTLIAREGWSRILDPIEDILVVGEAEHTLEIDRMVNELMPEILLMDLNWMGDVDAGWITIQELKKVHPRLKIVAITAYEHLISRARSVGADYALLKTFTRDQLIGVIRDLAKREPAKTIVTSNIEPEYFEKLSPREMEVLKILAKGSPDKEIALHLGIAESTAKNHVKSILSKLNASNRTEASNTARELGII
jgi:DNA-binding NarL/FixJ family response regulator